MINSVLMLLAVSLAATIADGDREMARGEYDAAAQHYRAEVAADPGAYEAKFKLARALSFSGRREEAIRLYTELLATRPDNSDLLLARGRAYAWDGRWREAEADLMAVTSRFPDYGDAWSALGDMYLWSDRPGEAANAYGKWIAADPGNPRAYIARAKVLASAGELEAARVDFEAARQHGVTDAEIDRYTTALRRRRQEPEAAAPELYKWSASLAYDRSRFSTGRSDWIGYTAVVRRYWERGSLGVEYLDARRFDTSDYALALDAYVDTWQRAYVNLRFQYAPNARVFPRDAYRAEVFQGVGKGWELSVSYDRLDFTGSSVDLYGVGVGKYTGDWYFRWRTLFIPSAAKTGVSHRALARYFYAGNSDDYVEVNGGFSSGGDFVQGATTVEATRGHGFGAVYQTYFAPQWGCKVAAGYYDEKTTVEQSIVEKSLSLKVMTRW